MICNCGAETRMLNHSKTVNKTMLAKLEYDCCPSCGRVGKFYLHELTKGTMTITKQGTEAKLVFEEKYQCG